MEPAHEVSNLHDVGARDSGFTADSWEGYFSAFILDTQAMKTYEEEIDVLKKQVRDMFVNEAEKGTKADKMNLIDTLERLGLSHHFDKELEEQVEQIFHEYDYEQEYDLCEVSLHFRIFRQHGYKMSIHVFDKFKDGEGKLLESVRKDIVGMLSLYEASHLRTHSDDESILKEALSFTKTNLKSSLEDLKHSNPFLAEQVSYALKQPLHRGLPRLEARHYIAVYQYQPFRNDTILKIAKLDFNRMQLSQKEELAIITRYWDKSGLITDVKYAKHRPVESYFWCSSGYLEPQYSLGRSMLTKAFLMATLVDDTYDSYGTFEELEHLTNAIERWDESACDKLPGYMKPLYKAILKVFEEFDAELAKRDMSHCTQYGKEGFKTIVRAYHLEVKMMNEGYLPTFEEYLEYALETSNHFVLRLSLMGLPEYATVEAFDWLFTKPKIANASALIGRLLNDIAGYKGRREKKITSPSPTAVDCYMKQYMVSEEEAIEELYKKIEDAWKDVNEELLFLKQPPHKVSNRIAILILNFTRAVNIIYRSRLDSLTHQGKLLKDDVKALFTDPIPI